MTETILWHDYETSGRDARRDRPLQFAAIRTTRDLEPIGEPLAMRAVLGEDVLPEPEACLVTRVVPDTEVSEDCLTQYHFARRIHEALSVPDTCTAGYNSIRFDDEFSRFMFWRNLLPVYDREWRNGNSRFDLLDSLRAAYALRPEGIEWPKRDDGVASFRLEHLTKANGIEHGEAHDAVADVWATIEMAQCLRRAQPKLFKFLFDGRIKSNALERLAIGSGNAVVHTSGKFASSYGCTSVVLPLGTHLMMKNQVFAADLRYDPKLLLDESVEKLQTLMFTRRSELPEGSPRVGLKTVHANRSPVVAPTTVLDDQAWERIQLDPATTSERAAFVKQHRRDILRISQQVFEREFDAPTDPDEALYDGFPSRNDAARFGDIHDIGPNGWREFEGGFDDPGLGELLFRMRAQTAPDTLDESEQARWQEHCRQKLHSGEPSRLQQIEADLARLREARADEADSLRILDEVEVLVRKHC